MGTLMTVFSGMAALLCLLVGLQLFVLEAQIGQAAPNDHPDSRLQFRQWQALAHTGAVMSLGAGVLIFLFGLRQHSSTVKVEKNPSGIGDSRQRSIDPESLSIRVFESDTADRFVEISPEPDYTEQSQPQTPSTLPTGPTPQAAPDVEPESDPTDSIVRSIREALDTESGRDSFPSSGHRRLSIFGRLFGFHRRR